MLYANYDNNKVLATRGGSGACPSCKEPLRPKCGQIMTHHWAHINDTGCTNEHEPETEWHLWWKSQFPKENAEVTVGEHRADVLTPSGIVIEFQHSGISPEQIAAREQEYGRMMWVLDAREAVLDGRIYVTAPKANGAPYWQVDITKWRRTLKVFTRPVFLDLDGYPEIFHVRDFCQRKQTKIERFYREQLLSWGHGNSFNAFTDGLMSEKLPWWMFSPNLPEKNKRF
jgi:competence protein CoiA